MVECAIVEYDFEYKPKNNKYNNFSIKNWSAYGCPLKYRVINDTDAFLYFPHRIVPKLFERKYMPLLIEYAKDKKDIDIQEIVSVNKDKLTVGDILRELKADYISIRWGQSRTILNAFDREAIAFAKNFFGAIIIFKKRGGYLAYYINKPSYGQSGANAHKMDLIEAINTIKELNNNPQDNINYSENVEDEIREHIMIQRL